MIEIDIPTIDPMQHEPKIFMGMTSRQCLCITPGVLLGALLFYLTFKSSMDLAVISLGLTVVPAVMMGWYTPYNMKCEQYLKLVYFNTFVANPKRIYKTDNEEAVKMLTMKERQDLEKKQKEQEKAARRKKSAKQNNDLEEGV